MKLKKNQFLKAVTEEDQVVYFTATEAAERELELDSSKVCYSDGDKWVEEPIRVIGIVEYEEDEIQPEPLNPEYTMVWDVWIDGEFFKLWKSNMSGELVPYWAEVSYE